MFYRRSTSSFPPLTTLYRLSYDWIHGHKIFVRDRTLARAKSRAKTMQSSPVFRQKMRVDADECHVVDLQDSGQLPLENGAAEQTTAKAFF